VATTPRSGNTLTELSRERERDVRERGEGSSYRTGLSCCPIVCVVVPWTGSERRERDGGRKRDLGGIPHLHSIICSTRKDSDAILETH
jgi:hypothetical protein